MENVDVASLAELPGIGKDDALAHRPAESGRLRALRARLRR
jgi:hypothetical protein